MPKKGPNRSAQKGKTKPVPELSMVYERVTCPSCENGKRHKPEGCELCDGKGQIDAIP